MLLDDPVPAIESYLAKGFKVFPLVRGGKEPLISRKRGGKGAHDATCDQVLIREWWKKTPRANIGIACGVVSGITVIDVDPKNGGEISIANLAARGLTFPPTLRQVTPNGGVHLIYRHIPCVKNWSNIKGLGRGIDTRTDGGYIAVAPSCIPRESDGLMTSYCWIDPATGELRDTAQLVEADVIAEFPAWVLGEIEALKQKQTYRAFQPIRPLTNEMAQARLGQQTDLIRSEHEGNRNGSLSSRAFYAYRNYVMTGIASESTLAAQLLWAAVSTGITRKESVETIQKAFEAAKRKAA